MISILIPVYDFDVTNLVNTLHKQANGLNIVFEIIVLDDNSGEKYKEINCVLDRLTNVHYFELEKNIGRSGIRNRLADMAKYEHLLFMDCDAEILYNNYLENYVDLCKGTIVVCGGWIYSPVAPKADHHKLRWKYGLRRESQTARERSRHPYAYFMTNNFLISKSIIKKHGFDESLTGYGHEDTLYAWELRKNNVPINHIDNPMIHLGLESNRVFLQKSRQRVRNLLKILDKLDYPKEIEIHARIMLSFNRLEKFKLLKAYCCLSRKTDKFMIRNLHGKYPSLLVFDLYKLGYLCQVHRKKKIKLADL